MKKIDVSKILAGGTIKEKALLICFANDDEGNTNVSLTSAEIEAIKRSLKSPGEIREYNHYLNIYNRYAELRPRLYALQQLTYSISYQFLNVCSKWEELEKLTDFCNCILLKNKDKELARYIEQSCKSWDVTAKVEKNEAGKLKLDYSKIQKRLDVLARDFSEAVMLAKSIITASDELQAKERARAFIPDDIKEMLAFFYTPSDIVPELYQRDNYLRLLETKGAEDRETKLAKKYAKLPSYKDIEVRPEYEAKAKKFFTI